MNGRETNGDHRSVTDATPPDAGRGPVAHPLEGVVRLGHLAWPPSLLDALGDEPVEISTRGRDPGRREQSVEVVNLAAEDLPLDFRRLSAVPGAFAPNGIASPMFPARPISPPGPHSRSPTRASLVTSSAQSPMIPKLASPSVCELNTLVAALQSSGRVGVTTSWRRSSSRARSRATTTSTSLLASARVVADVERRGPRQRKHDARVAPGGQATREGLERAGTARQRRERVRDVGCADARDRMRGGSARRRDGPLDDRDIAKQRAAAGRPAEPDHRRDAERVWLAQAKQSSYQLDAVRENHAARPACAEELGHSERVEPHIDRRSRKIDPERAEHALELELVPAVEQLLGVVNRKRKPVEHDDALPAPCEVTARRGCRGRMRDGGENEAAVGDAPCSSVAASSVGNAAAAP